MGGELMTAAGTRERRFEYALRNQKTGKLRFATTDAVHIEFLHQAFKTKGYVLVRREVSTWQLVRDGD